MKETKEDFDLRKFVPAEEQRRTFAKVFDKQTIQAVHRLATKGYFDIVEFVISTGKEAHVFRAKDKAGNFRAVKIYKKSTSDFKNMNIYLEGDMRFKGIRKNKRDIVFAWTKKEFKNLMLLNHAEVRVPMPIAFFENVLVMEFIGDKEGKAAPPLKELPVKDVKKAYKTIVGFIAKTLYKAELVHSDLSEYNILNKAEELVVIDAGQAVLTTHPEAETFFERDLTNVANYFSKKGVKKTVEEIKEEIKAKKGKI